MTDDLKIGHEYNLWEKENISLGIKTFDKEMMRRICKAFSKHIIKLEKSSHMNRGAKK